VAVTLTARRETHKGTAGYTLNHLSLGPEIRARQGQLVEVTLVNESVPDGMTLHWHGVDLPNAEDSVAAVTQDAVSPGGSYVYRFVAQDAGTY
jgi:FtsP/CotA-like multicopper oxidase with cupredoxin domain